MLTHIQYKTMPLLWSIYTCLKVTYRHKKPMSCCCTSIIYFIELQAIDSHYSFFLLSVNQLYIFLNYCWFRYLRMAENTSTYNCEPYNIGQCVHFCSRAWRIIRVIERRYVNISGRAWWDQWWNTPCYYITEGTFWISSLTGQIEIECRCYVKSTEVSMCGLF